MKAKVTALIIGLVLGSTSVAVGANKNVFWRHTAPQYICNGFQGAVNCRLRYTPFSVSAGRGQVVIFYGNQPLFQCLAGTLPAGCYDHR